jgi:hypothetical protein
MKLWRSVPMAGALALLLGALGAAPALACSTCYSAAAANINSPLVSGARLGVFLLIAVTAAVLGGFVRFFLYLRNRARQTEADQITSEWAQFQRSSST